MMPIVHQISALLLGVFVAGLWEGLALAAVGITLCSLMWRASARLRHTMLVALFGMALVLPWFHLRDRMPLKHTPTLQLAPWAAAGIALLWLSVAVLRVVQLSRAWLQLCAVRRHATPVAVQGIGVVCGGSRRALLCSSPDVDTPAMLGFGEPRLLLPDWMIPDLSQSELRQIALHECEHLRRGDDWLNLLLQVGITLFPFNPALLWLNRRISVERELATDAAVVSQTAQPLTYAACLTRLAERRRQHGRLRLALAAWERRSELVQRVHVLLDRSRRWTQQQSAWAGTAAAAAVLLVACSMLCAPQWVTVGRSATAVADREPLATVVSLPGMPLVTPGRSPLVAAKMLPVSFQAESRSLAAPRRLQKTTSPVNATSRAALREQRGPAPRIVRTAAVLTQPPYALRGHAVRLEHPDRLVTTDFEIPYVAVPTRNGWLLIEL